MSEATLHRTTWHGFEAAAIESEGLRLVVVPEAGGKIVSLYDQDAACEWLVTPEQSHPFRRLAYGTSYNENHAGGWDEMLPTIVAGAYPAPGRWQGTTLPDHGEVWTLPWVDAGSTGGRLSLAVVGQAMPYRLTRSIEVCEDHMVRLAYRLENLADERLAYLWAAHPQFACQPGAVIELPPEVDPVINVLPLEWGPEWGPQGTRNRWPALTTADGLLRQDVVAGPEAHRGRKFYVPPEQAIAWAGLRQPDGRRLRMTWNERQLPYCGVWIDEGCLNQVSDVAIEPSSGYYDGLALAWQNDRCSVLEPGGQAEWALTLHLGR